jgi:hypothetical protein
VDNSGGIVYTFSLSGMLLSQFTGNIQSANRVAISLQSGLIFVGDYNSATVKTFDATGFALSEFGSGDFGASSPFGLQLDPSGALLAVDVTSNQIRKYGCVASTGSTASRPPTTTSTTTAPPTTSPATVVISLAVAGARSGSLRSSDASIWSPHAPVATSDVIVDLSSLSCARYCCS